MITRDDLISATEDLLAGMPEGMCYRERIETIDPEWDGRAIFDCYYRMDEQPACLVGMILDRYDLIDEVEEYELAYELDVVQMNFDKGAVELLTEWQKQQDEDTERPWRDIVEKVR